MPLSPPTPCDRSTHGWSLPELLAVLSLIAIGTQAALPTWYDWQARMQALAVRDQLMMDLQAARVQARQQARALSLQALSDCAWHTPSPTDWSCGWQLVDAHSQRTLFTTPVNQPLQVRFTQSQPLVISERGDLGQVGERWTIQAGNAAHTVTHAICLSGAGRLRTVASASCG